MQAMFTGAETVAWWTMVGNKKANVAFLSRVYIS